MWGGARASIFNSSFPRTREPSCLLARCNAPLRVCGHFSFRPLGRVPFVKRWKATPAKRNQKGLPQHTGPIKPGYPHELPRHGGPPRGYVPVARGALATSMSHDLLSAGFARPSEGAFRCARLFLWKSKSKRAFAFAFRRSELAREPRSHWVPAFAGMTGIDRCFRMTLDSPFAEDSPLSRLRERAGERALFAEPQPLPQPRRKSVGRITPTALSAESRTESAPTVPGRHRRRSGLRPRLDSPPLRTDVAAPRQPAAHPPP